VKTSIKALQVSSLYGGFSFKLNSSNLLITISSTVREADVGPSAYNNDDEINNDNKINNGFEMIIN
jgi:hypothetical protein